MGMLPLTALSGLDKSERGGIRLWRRAKHLSKSCHQGPGQWPWAVLAGQEQDTNRNKQDTNRTRADTNRRHEQDRRRTGAGHEQDMNRQEQDSST